MSHPIPEPYKWDESFKTFYDSIDDEHKGLFDGVADLADNPASIPALVALDGLMLNHFLKEQAIMEAAKYSEIEEHKKIHNEFFKSLQKIMIPVSSENIQYLKDWLVNHIKNVDFKYKGKL